MANHHTHRPLDASKGILLGFVLVIPFWIAVGVIICWAVKR